MVHSPSRTRSEVCFRRMAFLISVEVAGLGVFGSKQKPVKQIPLQVSHPSAQLIRDRSRVSRASSSVGKDASVEPGLLLQYRMLLMRPARQ